MSAIDALIARLCLGWVEWKGLGEITTSIASGRNKARSVEGVIPVYGSTGPIGFTNEAAYSGDALLVARVGANAGLVNAVLSDFDVSDNTLVIRPTDEWNIRFAFHQLTHMNLNQYAVGGGQPLVTGGLLKSLKVPLPPLKEQIRIASILDKFDTLTSSITEGLPREIELRQKQYEYYRNLLFSFPNPPPRPKGHPSTRRELGAEMTYLDKLLDWVGVEWRALGEVAKKISSGGTPQKGVKEYWEGGTIPWMSSGEVNIETIYETENFITEAGLKNSSAKYVPKNSLVIALSGQGKTRGKVARTRIDLTTNQSLASIAVNKSIVNPDYLYHFIKTQYENLRQISSESGTRGGLNLQMISNYKFPLPCPENPKKSLEIQAEIVRILDAFPDMTAELTAELTARKKQYNYYRDRLMNFKKAV